MGKATWGLIAAMFKNRSKDLFIARLGAKLLLAKFGIVGLWADILAGPIRALIGVFIDEGLYAIDVTLDSIKSAMSIPEFKKAALTEYAKARRKDLTDEEKAQIRKEYLVTLDRFTRLRM
jgi:hypothetical protein